MAKRRRKKKRDQHGVDESWLLPYSDLMTLLLALFIVLFASSSVDAQKFQQMANVFNGIFSGGSGVMNYQNPEENEDHSQDNPDNEAAEALGDLASLEEAIKNSELAAELDREEREELEQLQSKINMYIQKNDLTNKFETSLTSEGLLLTIRDNVLFPSGKAEVRNEDLKTARELAGFLEMDPPRNVIISGHTDNVPIRNSNYKSNWELSVMRAVNFMKIILENKDLNPRWFSAKGFGEHQPIADNNTKEGREKNRRVEVLILPNIKTEK